MMDFVIPPLNSQLSSAQESSLRSLGIMYFNISQYVQKHLNVLAFPIFYSKLGVLGNHQVFKAFQHSGLFWDVDFFKSLPNINLFDLPKFSLCLDNWESDEELVPLVSFMDLTDSLVEICETISYRVLNRFMQENHQPMTPIESGLFNHSVFFDAIVFKCQDENSDELQFLRNYCNSNHYAVRYIKNVEKYITNIFADPVQKNRVYRFVLQEIYGGLNESDQILSLQNTELAEMGWYKKQCDTDSLKDNNKHNTLCEYLMMKETDKSLCYFIDLQQLQKDFQSKPNDLLRNTLNLLIEFV